MQTPSYLFREAKLRFLTCLVFLIFAPFLSQAGAVLRLHLSGAGLSDETVLYYQDGAGSGFDAEYDAYKLRTPGAAGWIAQWDGQQSLAINAIAPVTSAFSIPLDLLAPLSSCTLSASGIHTFPAGTRVLIRDLKTGKVHDLSAEPLVFTGTGVAAKDWLVIELIAPEAATEAGKARPVDLRPVGKNRFQVHAPQLRNTRLRVELLQLVNRQAVHSAELALLNAPVFFEPAGLPGGLYILNVYKGQELLTSRNVLIE